MSLLFSTLVFSVATHLLPWWFVHHQKPALLRKTLLGKILLWKVLLVWHGRLRHLKSCIDCRRLRLVARKLLWHLLVMLLLSTKRHKVSQHSSTETRYRSRHRSRCVHETHHLRLLLLLLLIRILLVRCWATKVWNGRS